MQEATISIVVPIHYESDNVQKLLPVLCSLPDTVVDIVLSVSDEDETDYRLLVPDDHRVQILASPYTSRAMQINYGCIHSKGTILWMVHADVIPPLAGVAEIFEAVKDRGVVAGWFPYRFHPSSMLLSINARATYRDGWHAGGGDQCQWFTRSAFDRLGGYRDLPIMEDFDIIKRLRKASYRYHICESPAVVSSRKYKANSYFKVNLVNLYVLIQWRIGADLQKLAKWYRKVL